jgi:predicted transposase YdaD
LIDIVAEYKNNLHKVVLHCLNKKNKYMVHLSEEERLQERAEGKQKGEQKECIKISKKLLHQNMDIVFISSIIGLSEKEIELLN